MKEMNLVSVVIPAYNRATVIEQSITSVLQQTYQNLEIIVVNDGSKDDTAYIVKNMMQNNPKIRYLEHEGNRGAQAARNTGIKEAKGEWIAFLDSDDRWLPDSLEIRLDIIQKEKIKVVHSECYIIQEDSTMIPFGVSPFSGQIYPEILTRPSPVFPSFLIAKEAIEKIGYLDEEIIAYQEWDLSIRLAKYYSFGFVKQPTFIYDCRGVDTISKNIIRSAKGYKQVFTKHQWEIIRVKGLRTLSQHYFNLAQLYDLVGNKKKSLYCKLIGFIIFPWRPMVIIEKLSRTFEIL